MTNKIMVAAPSVKRALRVNSSVGKKFSLSNLTKVKELEVNSSVSKNSSLADTTEFKQLAHREATLKAKFKAKRDAFAKDLLEFKQQKQNFTKEIQRLTKRTTREKARFKAERDAFEKELLDIQPKKNRIQETLFQNDPKGKPFVEVLRSKGIIPGIKVDKGLKKLIGGGEGEQWCSGLDDLAERTAKYYAQGARFAKWRTALRVDVDKGLPTNLAIDS